MSHILQEIRQKKHGYDHDSAVRICSHFIQGLTYKKCFRARDKHQTKYNCLQKIDEDDQYNIACSWYMVKWSGFTTKEKREKLYEWKRFSTVTGNFLLPIEIDEVGELEEMTICKHTLGNILDVGVCM